MGRERGEEWRWEEVGGGGVDMGLERSGDVACGAELHQGCVQVRL